MSGTLYPAGTVAEAKTREFETGAIRDREEGKPDYEGYLSPLVTARFGEYMTKHRKLPDGTLRDSDNWQKGIPQNVYIKSAWRHLIAWWSEHRGHRTADGIEEALCGLLFNVQGYLHERLRQKRGAAQRSAMGRGAGFGGPGQI